jgi:hypothetical protein
MVIHELVGEPALLVDERVGDREDLIRRRVAQPRRPLPPHTSHLLDRHAEHLP